MRAYGSEVNNYNPLDFSMEQKSPIPPQTVVSHLGDGPTSIKKPSPVNPPLLPNPAPKKVSSPKNTNNLSKRVDLVNWFSGNGQEHLDKSKYYRY